MCRLHALEGHPKVWNGNAPDLLCAANFRFGSNLLTEREVLPTPMGPAEGAEGGQPHLDRSKECRADRARPYRVTECAVMVVAQNEDVSRRDFRSIRSSMSWAIPRASAA